MSAQIKAKNTEIQKQRNKKIGRTMKYFHESLKPDWNIEQVARRSTVQVILNLSEKDREGLQIGLEGNKISNERLEEFYNCKIGKEVVGQVAEKKEAGQIKVKDCYEYSIPCNDGSSDILLAYHLSDDQMNRYYRGDGEVKVSELQAFCQILGISISEFMSLANSEQERLDSDSLKSLQTRCPSSSSKNKFPVVMTNSHYIENPIITDAIQKAKDCVFISGSGMSHVNTLYDKGKFENLAPNVTITFALPRTHEDKNLKRYVLRTKKEWEERESFFVRAVRKITEDSPNNKPRIIPLETFIPTAYIAVDYRETRSDISFINVCHYLFSKPPENNAHHMHRYSYIVHPEDGELYEDHRKQVLLLEQFGENLISRYS